MRFYLVRHGTTQGNVEGLLYGALDLPLTDRGREDAEALKEYFQNIQLGEIYSSDSRRTLETTALIFGARSLQVTDALRCMDFGALEGKTFAEVQKDHPTLARIWQEDFSSLCFPGGESMEGFKRRILAAWNEIYRQHSGGTDNILLMLHGGPIRIILFDILDIPLKNFYKINVPTASISVIEAAPDFCTIISAGERPYQAAQGRKEHSC